MMALNFQNKTRKYVIDWYACTIHKIKNALFQAGNTSEGLNKNLFIVIK